MNHNTDIDWNVAARILSGEAVSEEKKSFDLWLIKNEENKLMWDEIKKDWNSINPALKSHEIDVDGAWHVVKGQIFMDKHQKRNRVLRSVFWINVAAIFVLVFFVSQYFYNSPVKALMNEFVSYQSVNSFILEDGTTIDVNVGSKIIYPEMFSENERKINMEGEAFFKVAKDLTKPFIIDAGAIQIKVLGTSFNVQAYPNRETIEVDVETGNVEVKLSNGSSKNILVAGEKLVFDIKHQKVIKSKINNSNYLSWKTGKISFENSTLSEVIKTLEDVYHIKIEVSGIEGVYNKRLTADFDNQSQEYVIDIIERTLNVDISAIDNH